MHRAFTAKPFPVSAASLEHLERLQPLWNQLYDRVSRDHNFLQHALRASASACRWEARQLAVHGRTLARVAEKPQLLLPNSIYVPQRAPGCGGGDTSWVHTVGNVQVRSSPLASTLLHTNPRASSL